MTGLSISVIKCSYVSVDGTFLQSYNIVKPIRCARFVNYICYLPESIQDSLCSQMNIKNLEEVDSSNVCLIVAANMLPTRLPLSDLCRQRLRDDHLWTRELQRARQLKMSKIYCPCIECQGRRRILVRNVRDYLIQNGQDAQFRVWRGPGTQDSSDEEQEHEFWGPNDNQDVELDAQVDRQGMFDNAFVVAEHAIDVPDGGIGIEDDTVDVEELVQQEVSNAFMVADSVHEQCSEGSTNGEPEGEEVQDNHSMHSANEDGVPVEVNFDPTEMQEAIQELYRTSKYSKLAATILLMNLCTV